MSHAAMVPKSSIKDCITKRLYKLDLKDIQNYCLELDKEKLNAVIDEIVTTIMTQKVDEIKSLKAVIESHDEIIKKNHTEMKQLNAKVIELKSKIVDIEKKKALNANATSFVPRVVSEPSPFTPHPSPRLSQQTNTPPKTVAVSVNEEVYSDDEDAPKLRDINIPLYKAIRNAIRCTSDEEEVHDDLNTIVAGKMIDFFAIEENRNDRNMYFVFNCFMVLGINTSTCRVNSATILVKLCNNVDVEIGCKYFIDHMLLFCNDLFIEKIDFIRNNSFAATAYNCVHFFTELFLKLVVDNQSSTKDLVFYLKDCMKLLLEKDIGSLKCMVNIIKLSGKQLYEIEKVFGHQQFSMDTLFDKTKKVIVMKTGIDRCTRRMLMSIVELRAAEWGEDQGPLNNDFPTPVSDVSTPLKLPLTHPLSHPLTRIIQDSVTPAIGDNLIQEPSRKSGLPNFLIQNGMPDMLGDELQYLMNNFYLEDDFDEEMMEAFEKFQADN